VRTGIANYRDQIHERFFQRLNRRNIVQFVVCAAVLPAVTYFGCEATIRHQRERDEEARKNYKMPESRKINKGLQ